MMKLNRSSLWHRAKSDANASLTICVVSVHPTVVDHHVRTFFCLMWKLIVVKKAFF